jgi:hypothetical protein
VAGRKPGLAHERMSRRQAEASLYRRRVRSLSEHPDCGHQGERSHRDQDGAGHDANQKRGRLHDASSID